MKKELIKRSPLRYFVPKQHSGLSTIITTLMFILLALVLIFIVWIVVQNFVLEGSEEIDLGKFTIDLDIKGAVAGGESNDISVKVKRVIGKGELVGIVFIFEKKGENSKRVERKIEMEELEEESFDFSLEELDSLVAETVSVAPIYKTSSGKEIEGDIVDSYRIREIIEGCTPDCGGKECGDDGCGGSCGSCGANEECSSGICVDLLSELVGFWEFENDVLDSVGSNDGVNLGASFVSGKIGTALNFDGSDYVQVGDSNSLDFTTEFTIGVWVKVDGYTGENDKNRSVIASKYVRCPDGCGNNGQSWVLFSSNDKIVFSIFQLAGLGSPTNSVSSKTTLTQREWYHVVAVFNQSVMEIYIDGVKDKSKTSLEVTSLANSAKPFLIGSSWTCCGYSSRSEYRFIGGLDEVRVWNRALDEQEINVLYNL